MGSQMRYFSKTLVGIFLFHVFTRKQYKQEMNSSETN
jgi:hypothetical protein